MYVVILYLLYFQYMLGYTVHLIEVYSKLPIIVRLHMHVTSYQYMLSCTQYIHGYSNNTRLHDHQFFKALI